MGMRRASIVINFLVLLSAALRDIDAPRRHIQTDSLGDVPGGTTLTAEAGIELSSTAEGPADTGEEDQSVPEAEQEEPIPQAMALFQTSAAQQPADGLSAEEEQSGPEEEQEEQALEATALFQTRVELDTTDAGASLADSSLPRPVPPISLLLPAFGGLLDGDEDDEPQINLDSRAGAAAASNQTKAAVAVGVYTASGSVTVWLVTAVLVAALVIAGTVLLTLPSSKAPDNDGRWDRRGASRAASASQRGQRILPPARNQQPGQMGGAGLGQPGQMQPDLLVQDVGAARSPSFTGNADAGANTAQMQQSLLRSPGGSFAGPDTSAPSAPPSPMYASARGMSDNASMSSGEREDTMPLATGLVVNNVDGLGIVIPWELGPGPQDTVVVVRDIATKNTIANAFVSERGPDPGILLETAQRDTFAFLDTSLALVGFGAVAQTNRRVVLRRASVGGWDVAGPPYAVLFLNTNAGGSTLIARRGGPAGRVGRNLLSLNMDANGQVINIVDATGRLMATAENSGGSSPPLRGAAWSPGQQQATPRQNLLRVAHGADAGLVLCAVFGAHKLR